MGIFDEESEAPPRACCPPKPHRDLLQECPSLPETTPASCNALQKALEAALVRDRGTRDQRAKYLTSRGWIQTKFTGAYAFKFPGFYDEPLDLVTACIRQWSKDVEPFSDVLSNF